MLTTNDTMTPPRPLPLAELNRELAQKSAEERLRWAAARFGAGAVILSSMQKSASVLMHMLAQLGLPNEILFVDTGYHFHETLRVRDQFMRRYKLNVVTLYPAQTVAQQEVQFGGQLYRFGDGQPVCCRLRKEEPFVNYMRSEGKELVVLGLRRTEGGARGNLKPLQPDPRFDGHALLPLFDWSDERMTAYLKAHDVPVHPLHEQGYPSIGCQVCTTPVGPGENPRAGRWRHLREAGDDGPQYCNINFSDGSGI